MDVHDTFRTLRREVRLLRGYALLMTGVFLLLCVFAFAQDRNKTRFGEIDVERINIVEKDGKLRLVLSNVERAPDLILKGKTIKRASGASPHGIIFYNNEGDESGALITHSRKHQSGEYNATSRLVFDQFENDETIAIQYVDENGRRYAGLVVWDRPETPTTEEIAAEIREMWRMPEGPEKYAVLDSLRGRGVFEAWRVFVGKQRNKSSVVSLFDRKSQPRLQLVVDSLGVPRLDFLNEQGEVFYRLPDSAYVAKGR